MFYVRSANTGDLAGLVDVAQHLDSINLPHDREKLGRTIDTSCASFREQIKPADREFLFVMIERSGERERVAGCSMIFAQHGSRRSPHVFFDVIDEERYSESLDRHFRHQVLRMGYNYAGLTEIGGLVMQPALRRHPERLGRMLVMVRFAYMALHRDLFRDEVLSELMPPLGEDGTSALWEALGRKFTGLSYQEADRLSRENKEFIRTLFPQDPIYTCLLPGPAQALIGKVGPHTQGVEKMLLEMGFRYSNRIDPFDGGPHFSARTDDIVAVKNTHRARVVIGAVTGANLSLVSTLSANPAEFRAVQTSVHHSDGIVTLSTEAAGALGVSAGADVGVLPL